MKMEVKRGRWVETTDLGRKAGEESQPEVTQGEGNILVEKVAKKLRGA